MKSDNHRFLTALAVVALLLVAGPRAEALVVTYIDLLDTTQLVATNNATVTDTIASANSIGGFRTISLTTSGGNPIFGPSVFGVDGSAQEVLLSTPSNHIPFYELKWGGAGGTAGLGGVDVTGGAPYFTLGNTFVNFSLIAADVPSSFTWTFTDTSTNVATYSGTIAPHSSANPAIEYAVGLASFSGAGSIDWSSINFISLSGGGPVSLDLSFGAPISVAVVPEPGTWAAAGLLLLTAVYIRWRRSRSTTTEEAPAAA